MAGGVECEDCGKRFRSRYNLRIHKAVHSGVKSHCCHLCDRKFQQKHNLVTHISRVHGGVKPFNCRDCGKSFGYSSHFKAHVKTHFVAQLDVSDAVKDVVLRPYPCSVCARRFETVRRLEEHTRRHTREKMFTCDSCRRQFSTRRAIVQHINRKCSTEEKKKGRLKDPTPCEICGKAVARYSMTKHLNIHTRTRIYKCSTCGRDFLEAGQRAVHERIHSGSQPHCCELCGKGHAQYGNLLAHRRRHHGLTDRPSRKEVQQTEEPVEDISNAEPLFTPVKSIEYVVEIQPANAFLSQLQPVTSAFQENEISCPAFVSNENVFKSPSDLFATQENAPSTLFNPLEPISIVEGQLTGGETIKDFLELAAQWVSTRVQESKMTQTEEIEEKDGNSEDQGEELGCEDMGLENKDDGTAWDAEDSSKRPAITSGSASEDTQESQEWRKTITKSRSSFEALEETQEFERPATRSLGKEKIKEVIQSENSRGDTLQKQEVWEKLMGEIGNDPVVKTALKKVSQKGKEDCLIRLLRRVGEKLPENSVVRRGGIGALTWRCWDCDTNFSSRYLLLRHRLVHQAAHLHPHRCSICGRTFTQAGNLQHHLLVHKKEFRFSCHVCGAKFRHKSHFRTHISRHEDSTSPAPRFQCETCGKASDTKFHLEEHIRTHTKERPLLCKTCGAQFAASSSYNRHLSQHEGIRESCSTCKKTFSDASSRRRHEASHLGRKMHPCACGRSFTQSSSLRRHAPICPQAIAPPAKSFVCQACGKPFLDAAGLKRHAASHDPTRRFACHYCSLALKTKETLGRHLARHRATSSENATEIP